MENKSDLLTLSGAAAHCPDCGDTTMFVPVQEGCDVAGCEFCCTTCDAAVYLVDLTESSHQVLSWRAG